MHTKFTTIAALALLTGTSSSNWPPRTIRQPVFAFKHGKKVPLD